MDLLIKNYLVQSWKPEHKDFNGSNHLALQQGMYNYHVNGWSDIGQHVTLTPDGKWVTGRPFNIAPASIKGWNTGAFAVEMIGNFDIEHDKFEGKQKESMLKFTKYFIDKYGEQSIKEVDFNNIVTVREFTEMLLKASGESKTNVEYANEKKYVKSSAEYGSYDKPLLRKEAAQITARVIDTYILDERGLLSASYAVEGLERNYNTVHNLRRGQLMNIDDKFYKLLYWEKYAGHIKDIYMITEESQKEMVTLYLLGALTTNSNSELDPYGFVTREGAKKEIVDKVKSINKGESRTSLEGLKILDIEEKTKPVVEGLH